MGPASTGPRRVPGRGRSHQTERTSRDLPTQVRHEAGTPDRERACPVAPEFLEWLMGYPRGWTRAAAGKA